MKKAILCDFLVFGRFLLDFFVKVLILGLSLFDLGGSVRPLLTQKETACGTRMEGVAVVHPWHNHPGGSGGVNCWGAV